MAAPIGCGSAGGHGSPFRFALGLAIALTLAAAAPGPGQLPRLRFDHLSREQDLSQVSVLDVLQDRRGFLWIATQDGLNRFDGYGFTVFKHDPVDPSSLSQSQILDLYEDRDGLLWIVPFAPGALDRFDPATESFRRYLHDPASTATLSPVQIVPGLLHDDGRGFLWLGLVGGGIDRLDKATGAVVHLRSTPGDDGSLASDAVSCFFEDRQGTLWIGNGRGGVDRLLPGDGAPPRFAHQRHRPNDSTSLGDDTVLALFEDRSGRLWVGTRSGLALFDRERGTFRRYSHAAGPSTLDAILGITATLRSPIVEDAAGRLWIATAAGVSRFDPASGRFTDYLPDIGNPHALSSNQISSLLVDRTGQVWVGTQGGGLNLYRREIDGFLTIHSDPANPQSLGSDFVTALAESREGVLWIGTTDAGLSRYSPLKNGIRHYGQDASDPASLADDMVFSVLEDSAGTLWIGTFAGGLHRLDADRAKVLERYANLPGSPRDLGADFVRSLHEDRRGRFWVGTFGGGIALVDRERGRVERRWRNDPRDPSSLSSDNVFSIDEDRGGELWIATGNGWNRFDPEAGTFTRYLNDPNDPASLVNNATRFTREDRAGGLWVGTNLGLSRFDRKTGAFTNYRSDPRRPQGLANDNVLDLHEDAQGRIWLATYGGGLEELDPRTGEVRHHTVRDGLASDSIYSVLPDERGFYWVSSNNGIARFDPRSESFETFDVGDGLQSSEFNGGAFFRSRRGELFFGGVHGVNAFFPDAMRLNDHVPPVVLTAFRRLGRLERFDRSLAELDEIVLSHKDKLISFDFAALDYTHPEKNRYAYRLDGFDSDWIDNGTRRTAQYTNLDPGAYTFHVKGSNGDGVWNEQGASVRLRIIPPPWRRWWAYLAYATLAWGALVGYVRFKNSTHREELEQQRVAAEVRRNAEELERARRLQLSLLPAAPPQLPAFEIATHIQTATEVGGDYYDFHPQSDGSLSVVTGDATGHGLSAGMMVGMTRAAIQALGLASLAAPATALRSLDRVLRAVHPERMHMALNLVHLSPARLVLSSAGMPPAFLYRAATRAVEEILLPGLPLGSPMTADYVEAAHPLHAGDLLLLISDGLPELRNADGQMLGYAPFADLLAAHGARPAAEIVHELVDLAREWSGDRAPDDDITLLAIRIRPTPEGARGT